jgi:hypothetical protein
MNPLLSGEYLLNITIEKGQNNAVQRLLDEIGTDVREWELTIEKRKKKRSLDSNAYAWSLIGKIADVLRASKEQIYLTMLQNYGQSTVISVLSSIEVKGFFKYYDEFGKGTVNGKEFTHYKVYKGSSEYDSREMAILIDGIVSEAQALNIQTLTPAEIERMNAAWKGGK